MEQRKLCALSLVLRVTFLEYFGFHKTTDSQFTHTQCLESPSDSAELGTCVQVCQGQLKMAIFNLEADNSS